MSPILLLVSLEFLDSLVSLVPHPIIQFSTFAPFGTKTYTHYCFLVFLVSLEILDSLDFLVSLALTRYSYFRHRLVRQKWSECFEIAVLLFE